jgi:glycosyltransferase involved in cell wall biosynthesis
LVLKNLYYFIIISCSGFFDRNHYLTKYPDVRKADFDPVWHYIKIGWEEGRNPSADFDTNFYLQNNPDVRKTGTNPLMHYIFFGQHENRPPAPTPSETQWKQAQQKRPWQSHIHHFPQGLNVVGFLQTAKGLAEVIRYNRYAYKAADIKYSLIDYEFSIPEHQKIIPIPDHEYINDFKFNTNIFHINPPQFPYVWEAFPEDSLTGRYSIGVWYWELPEFPDDWCFAFDLVDEVWVASEFVQESVSAKTNKPVIKIPPCVYLDQIPKYFRSDFNLPENRFLFLCAFDVLSSPQRKNPLGAIEAFKEAFPQNDSGVGLVIKVNNAPEKPHEMAALTQALAGYENIYFINEVLSRAKLNALINLVDVYVSLHRSEGFGLVPAEAMILGKPVIMTRWSGNLELMTPANACGVDYELVNIQEDDGPYKKGQLWAEPDIEHAAAYMKKLRKDVAFYQELSINANIFIQDKFSPRFIGTKMANRLRSLGLQG